MRAVKILTFNILRDGQQEGGDRRARIARVVGEHDPDFLCMQEGGDDAYWASLAEARGFEHARNVPGEFQPALFSKLAVRTQGSHSGVKYVYFRVALAGRTLGVYSIHLVHAPPKERERVAALKRLCAFIDAQADDLVCVAGDFNSRTRGESGLSWGIEAIARHSECTLGPDDWVRATDTMRAAGYVDCYRRLHSEPGYSLHPLSPALAQSVPSAWHAWQQAQRAGGALPVPPFVRIDYVYANAALAERLTDCYLDESTLALSASDHLPLAATFALD